MKRARSVTPAFDRDMLAGADRNEAIHLIGQYYHQALQRHYGHNQVRSEILDRFANSIVDRDAWSLEYIINGLNQAAKETFSEITGVDLPKGQKASWEIMKSWGGITPEAERLKLAENRERMLFGDLRSSYGNPAELKQSIIDRMDEGYARIQKSGNQYYLCNEQGMGIALSTRSSRLASARPYIEAMIELREAQQAHERSLPVPAKDEATVPMAEVDDVTDVFSLD